VILFHSISKEGKQWDISNNITISQARAQDVYVVLNSKYIQITTCNIEQFDEKQKSKFATIEKVL